MPMYLTYLALLLIMLLTVLVQRLNHKIVHFLKKEPKFYEDSTTCIKCFRRGGTLKVLWKLFFQTFPKKTICLHRKQLVLVGESSINAVQSLQLEHDGLSNLHMEVIVFPPWQQAISLKLLFFKERIKVLEFQFTQTCIITSIRKNFKILKESRDQQWANKKYLNKQQAIHVYKSKQKFQG